MQSATFGSLIAAAILALGAESLAAGPETYQVTGPVLEVNDSMIAVQKGKDGGNPTQFERQILKRKHSPTFVSALRSIVHRRVCRNGKRAEVRRNQLEIINDRRE